MAADPKTKRELDEIRDRLTALEAVVFPDKPKAEDSQNPPQPPPPTPR